MTSSTEKQFQIIVYVGSCYSACIVILTGTKIDPFQLFVRLYNGLDVIRSISLCHYLTISLFHSRFHAFTIYSESFICTARHAERIKDVSLEARLIASSSDLSIQ